MKIVVTGAGGLLGHHAAVRLHGANCAARFRGDPPPYEMAALDRAAFSDDERLRACVDGADAVLHFAGVNRGEDDAVEVGNVEIANRLARACADMGGRPHVVYANSIQAGHDTPYGRGKARAGEALSTIGGGLTDLVLPHIFGEGARPNYNNVTATFIAATHAGETPEIDSDGRVSLLHAGEAARIAIAAAEDRAVGRFEPPGRETSVVELWDKLTGFAGDHRANVYPDDLRDDFSARLYNCWRAPLYPDAFPRPLTLNTDARGTLFEAVKGGGGGQTFLSWTEPGVTRGDHFHLEKVERFLVVSGRATIRLRPVLGDAVREYHVSGDAPAVVDMPTLVTHSIENTGPEPLLTLFWTHRMFDPEAPDTFFDPALAKGG